MAIDAAIPLEISIGNGTLLVPFGEGKVLMLKKIEMKIKKIRPNTPRINGLSSIDEV